MRRFIVFLSLLFLGFVPAIGVAEGVDMGLLVPREVFIGDEALLEFTTVGKAFLSFEGETLSLAVELLPESSLVTIKSVEYMKTDVALHVSVRFVPWVSGTLSLPPLPFQSSFVQAPEIRISSILARTGVSVPQNPREPLLVPGTTWLVYALLAVLVLSIGLLLFLVFRILPRLSGFTVRFLHSRNRRATLRSLRKLERVVIKLPQGTWYSLFSRVMRRYLALSLEQAPEFFFSSTTGEIVLFITSRVEDSFAQSIEPMVLRFFSEIDTKRFCGAEAEDTRLGDIVHSRTLIRTLEALNV